MAKVAINIQAPLGYIVARAVNNLQKAANDIAQAQAAAAMTLPAAPGNNSLDTTSTIGTALWGGAEGSSADYAYALGALQSALAPFMSTNAGSISTLYNGDVN